MTVGRRAPGRWVARPRSRRSPDTTASPAHLFDTSSHFLFGLTYGLDVVLSVLRGLQADFYLAQFSSVGIGRLVFLTDGCRRIHADVEGLVRRKTCKNRLLDPPFPDLLVVDE